MTPTFIFHALRRYGFKGLLDFFKRKIRKGPLETFLSERTQSVAPIPGITIIGCLDMGASLSKTLRDFAILLKKSGIPYQALNTPCDHPIPESEYQHLLTPVGEFVSNKYTDIVTMRNYFKLSDSRVRCSAIEFWEFEDGVKEYQPEILNIKSIIAMSDFNRDVFRKTAPNANVSKILYPFQFNHGPLADVANTRRKYGIPEKAFVIFFNFDYQSSYYRKNSEAILHAFRRAFSNDKSPVIVFKTMRAKLCHSMSNRLHALAQELGIADRLITIDDFIPQEDLVNLTNACDVYMSLHRGEGFGIGIAEAMALGKPVIVTDYSSTTEFCNADNALLVPYKMVEIKSDQHDVEAYDHVTHWAEPDIDFAAKALRQFYESPKLRQKLGENGRHFIEEHFSTAEFKKSIEAFLTR